jgi:hypothetical protein
MARRPAVRLVPHNPFRGCRPLCEKKVRFAYWMVRAREGITSQNFFLFLPFLNLLHNFDNHIPAFLIRDKPPFCREIALSTLSRRPP